MPLIISSSSKNLFVTDFDAYDCSEYIIASKIVVTSKYNKFITIEHLRKVFSDFGALKRIEIFSKGNEKFAHVTFKNSIHTYLALLFFQNVGTKDNVEVRLALYHEQMEGSPIEIVPDDCLIEIFKYLNSIHDEVAILSTCTRFRDIMNAYIFNEQKIIRYSGHHSLDGITTACQLVKHINSNGYKIYLSSQKTQHGFTMYDITIWIGVKNKTLNIAESLFINYKELLSEILKELDSLILGIDSFAPIALGNYLPCPNIKSMFFVSPAISYERYHVASLNSFQKLTTIGFKHLNLSDLKIHTDFEHIKKLNRIILSDCRFYDTKNFISSIIDGNITERKSIELIYDKIMSYDNRSNFVEITDFDLIRKHDFIRLVKKPQKEIDELFLN